MTKVSKFSIKDEVSSNKALKLLRKQFQSKYEVREEGDEIVFGEIEWELNRRGSRVNVFLPVGCGKTVEEAYGDALKNMEFEDYL